MNSRNAYLGLDQDKKILVRPLTHEDVEAVSELEAKAFSMPWKAADFWDMVNRDDSIYVVALNEEEIIGCCGATNACGDGDINNVVVEEAYRKMGIGRFMLKTMMDWGKDVGIENYTLEVRVSNKAAIALYEGLGFTSAGVRPNFYEKPREDAMIMWKR